MNLLITILKELLIISILVYVGFGLYLFIFQKNYIYYPSNQDFNSCPGFAQSQKLNLNGTRVYYQKNSKDIIVFYHGNGGSACDRAHLKEIFEKIGLSYAFVEYAGYAQDLQKPSKNLILEDVENVNEFIRNQGFSKITLAGESLGASLAIYHSSLIQSNKLLLITPFFKMSDIAKKHYGIYPISLLLKENYDNSLWIKNSKSASVEIIHGEKDEIIPLNQSRKLFNEIAIANKKLTTIKDAHHNDIYNFEETVIRISNYLSY